jgi:hypothetical protein
MFDSIFQGMLKDAEKCQADVLWKRLAILL